MSRRLAPLTLDTLADLPDACRSCVAWELDAVAAARARRRPATPEFEKEAWLSAVLLEWGSCGRIAYVDDEPVGFVTYAPPAFVPALAVVPDLTGQRRRRAADDRRGCSRVHRRRDRPDARAGGREGPDPPRRPRDRGVRPRRRRRDRPTATGAGHGCVVPADLLLAVGFKTVRPHHRYPRLRLDLRTALSWREDVEHALERILGTVRVPALSGRSRSADY